MWPRVTYKLKATQRNVRFTLDNDIKLIEIYVFAIKKKYNKYFSTTASHATAYKCLICLFILVLYEWMELCTNMILLVNYAHSDSKEKYILRLRLIHDSYELN